MSLYVAICDIITLSENLELFRLYVNDDFGKFGL